jgi:hypothetical protein
MIAKPKKLWASTLRLQLHFDRVEARLIGDAYRGMAPASEGLREAIDRMIAHYARKGDNGKAKPNK